MNVWQTQNELTGSYIVLFYSAWTLKALTPTFMQILVSIPKGFLRLTLWTHQEQLVVRYPVQGYFGVHTGRIEPSTFQISIWRAPTPEHSVTMTIATNLKEKSWSLGFFFAPARLCVKSVSTGKRCWFGFFPFFVTYSDLMNIKLKKVRLLINSSFFFTWCLLRSSLHSADLTNKCFLVFVSPRDGN